MNVENNNNKIIKVFSNIYLIEEFFTVQNSSYNFPKKK